MKELKKYAYEISGITDGEKAEKLVEEVKKVKDVADASFEDGYLYYYLPPTADEYDVLVSSIEICDGLNAELIIGDDYGNPPDEKKNEDFGGVDVYEECSKVVEADKKHAKEKNEKENSDNSVKEETEVVDSTTQLFECQDRIVSAKKTLKKETIIRFCELLLSVVLAIIPLFIPRGDGVISVGVILSVVAFAVGGYEIFYTAVVDLFKHKRVGVELISSVAALLGAFFGLITPVTVCIVVLAVANEISGFAAKLSAVTLDEIFYTGSMPVELSGGGKRSADEVKTGDELSLNAFDVVPTDCVACSAARVDAYRAEGVYEKSVEIGDTVYGGSVVLTESLKVKAICDSENCRLKSRKKEFENKISDKPQIDKKLTIIDLSAFVLAIALCFVIPAFTDSYSLNLSTYVEKSVAIVFVLGIARSFALSFSVVRYAFIVMKYAGVDFCNEELFNRLATADSVVVKASALTNNGELKEDTLGVLKELYYRGAKNVTVDFDCPLPDEVRNKIDLVDKSFKGEKKITAGNGGDVVFEKSDDKIVIENGEISMLPLVYAAAKSAKIKSKRIIIANTLVKVLCVVCCVLVPATIISPVYVSCVAGLATVFSSIDCLVTANVKE